MNTNHNTTTERTVATFQGTEVLAQLERVAMLNRMLRRAQLLAYMARKGGERSRDALRATKAILDALYFSLGIRPTRQAALVLADTSAILLRRTAAAPSL